MLHTEGVYRKDKVSDAGRQVEIHRRSQCGETIVTCWVSLFVMLSMPHSRRCREWRRSRETRQMPDCCSLWQERGHVHEPKPIACQAILVSGTTTTAPPRVDRDAMAAHRSATTAAASCDSGINRYVQEVERPRKSRSRTTGTSVPAVCDGAGGVADARRERDRIGSAANRVEDVSPRIAVVGEPRSPRAPRTESHRGARTRGPPVDEALGRPLRAERAGPLERDGEEDRLEDGRSAAVGS